MTFFIIITVVWSLINFYLGVRYGGRLRLFGNNRVAVYALLSFLALLLPLTFYAQKVGADHTGYLSWITFTWAGFALTLFPLLLAIDALTATGLPIYSRFQRWRAVGKNFDPDRRVFLLNGVDAGVLVTSGFLGGYGTYLARSGPKAVNVSIPIENLSRDLEGFSFAQITDTHIGKTIRRNYIENIVSMVNGFNADVICVTGDIADGYVRDHAGDVEPFSSLRSNYGAYFVTGNHEYYWDCQAWLVEMQRQNMRALMNEHVVINKGGANLCLAGVTDYSAGNHLPSHESAPEKALKGAPESDVTVMMAHQPRSAPAVAMTKCDLMISGHTHGGQFFPWNYIVPGFHPVPTGFSEYRGMKVYVSRGSGYWGPPMRTGVTPEVTLLTLTRKAA